MGDTNNIETRPILGNNSNISMEISVFEASLMFPGFRFSPTDEELIRYYLKKKLQGSDRDVQVIPEVDICRHEPWDLPALSVIQSDKEWFFFSPRGKKYPNGSQSKRATNSGYWKATGKERGVKSGSNVIGTKRTLVFHTGRAPKGQRTEWIMHEYCTSEKSQDSMVVCRIRKNNEFNLNDNNTKREPKNALSGSQQAGMVNGTAVADGFTQECGSSNNSHSFDTGSDCDERPTNEFSQHGSSSHMKSSAEEEDCYADIMKDDIIKLDEDSSINETQAELLLPVSAMKLKSHMKSNQQQQPAQDGSVHPLQGTVNRRIRLRRHRLQPSWSGRYEKYKFDKEICEALSLTKFPVPRSRVQFVFPFFVIILLVLYLCFMGDPLLSY